jgi:diguanylate cyclase (GGDEF)-like protein
MKPLREAHLPPVESARQIDQMLLLWRSAEIWADPDLALTVATHALKASQDIAYLSGQAHALLVIAGVTYINGDCNRSEELLDEAEALFALVGDEHGRACVVPYRGFIWLEREDFSSALEQQSAALEVARSCNDRTLEVELLNDMGTQYHYVGQMDQAIRCLYQALELARTLPTRNWEGYVTMNIGATSIERSEMIESVRWIRNAADIFTEIGSKAGLAYCEMNLAEVAERNNDMLTALRHLHSAESLVIDQRARAHVFCEIGRINETMGNFDAAIDALKESTSINRRFPDDYQQSRAAISEWRIARITGEWSQTLLAQLQFAEVLTARSGASMRKHFQIYDALIDTCRNLGELELALDYSAKAMEAKESFWMGLAEQRSILTSKLHQLHDAQQLAEKERVQRIEVERLHMENLTLMAELQQKSLRLEQQAFEDPLTRLGNRRSFDERLQRETRATGQLGTTVSVALIDVDHFKRINDRYTHGIGDLVLRQLAETMRSMVREDDVVSRYGGEEFAVLLPETDLSIASEVIENVRLAVESFDWSEFGKDLSVTISAGLVAGSRGSDAARLMAGADSMLYLAKHRGRNQVRSIELAASIATPGERWETEGIVMSQERMQRFALPAT